MGKIDINYWEVDRITKSTKEDAQLQLQEYAEKEYTKIRDALTASKGSYKEAMIKELDVEQELIVQTAEFITKLNTMIKNSAESHRILDEKYKIRKIM